jgi:hypothetical protein
MEKREILNLEVNQKQTLELQFDRPLTGTNKYGEYFCYTVKNGKDTEFSFFAPQKVHEILKDQKKGTRFQITKTAVEKNKKLVQDFDIVILNNGVTEKKNESKPEESEYFEAMLKSYEEATKIQNKFSAVNLNQAAVTLFIARTKTNGFTNYPKD